MEQSVLSKMTVKALRALAHELGVKRANSMKKKRLIAALMAVSGQSKAVSAMDQVSGAPDQSLDPSPAVHPDDAPFQGSSSLFQGSSSSVLKPAMPTAAPRLSELSELPEHYGTTRVVLLVQKPGYLYTYWEITEDDLNQARAKANGDHVMVLRVREQPGDGFHDIEIHSPVGDWFFSFALNWQQIFVELGLLTADGRFISLARSADATQAVSTPSARTDPKWSVREGEFESIYALSGGLTQRGGSEQIQRILREGWSPSSAGASHRSQG